MKSNPKLPLFFTLEAQGDLQNILQYTIETWGQRQADIYNQKLNRGFQRIQENPYVGRSREDILPQYKVLPVEKHLVIYWLRNNHITIIRVLHQSQDTTRYL